MTDDWMDIDTAPKGGDLVFARRVFADKIVCEGVAYFGTVVIDYGSTDAATRRIRHSNVWVTADGQYLFPRPTHWKPIAAPSVTLSQH